MSKAKYWTAVLYPESMVENWEVLIDDLLQVPYSYCIHDKDCDQDGVIRKLHIHLVIAFPNTTTMNHALSVFKRLQETCSYCEQVLNIRYLYNYLIHDTDSCRKQGKYLYKVEDRICGNGFDIGLYEQLSITDKREMLHNLVRYIINEGVENFTDFVVKVEIAFSPEYFS